MNDLDKLASTCAFVGRGIPEEPEQVFLKFAPVAWREIPEDGWDDSYHGFRRGRLIVRITDRPDSNTIIHVSWAGETVFKCEYWPCGDQEPVASVYRSGPWEREIQRGYEFLIRKSEALAA